MAAQQKRGRGRPPSAITIAKREAEEKARAEELARAREEGRKEALMTAKQAPTPLVTEKKAIAIDGMSLVIADQLRLILGETAKAATAEIEKNIHELREQMAKVEGKRITIKTDRATTRIDGIVHHNFEKLLTIVGCNIPVLMKGPAGSGKTHAAEMVAKALSLPFYAISVGAQTSESRIIGYMGATGEYVRTQFRDAYEHGGVYLMDEIDAGNANVLVTLNAALAGHYCAFPDKMVKRHDDFRFVATANTWGTGADRTYVGRNQLDAATLDRFANLEWPIDELLEWSFVDGSPLGDKWCGVVQTVRAAVRDKAYRIVVSPRATLRGMALLESGMKYEEVLEMTLLMHCSASERQVLKPIADSMWKMRN